MHGRVTLAFVPNGGELESTVLKQTNMLIGMQHRLERIERMVKDQGQGGPNGGGLLDSKTLCLLALLLVAQAMLISY